MTDKIEAATREKVAALFPVIALKVTKNYQDLINAGAEKFNDKTNHKAYYEACKAAVAHLQLLLKLAEWAEVPADKNALKQEEMEGILSSLQTAVDSHSAAYNDDGEVA